MNDFLIAVYSAKLCNKLILRIPNYRMIFLRIRILKVFLHKLRCYRSRKCDFFPDL